MRYPRTEKLEANVPRHVEAGPSKGQDTIIQFLKTVLLIVLSSLLPVGNNRSWYAYFMVAKKQMFGTSLGGVRILESRYLYREWTANIQLIDRCHILFYN